MKQYIVETKGYYPEGSFNNIIKITPSERRAKNIAVNAMHRLMCELRGNVTKKGDIRHTTLSNDEITFVITIRRITKNQVENL